MLGAVGVMAATKGDRKPKGKDSDDKPTIAKSATDLQRIKLEKLMKNPDKPVVIPARPKDKSNPHVPDFVRNVMGSSAGAGSGEFHVYRHLRRKEYARQKYIQEKGEKELLDDAYQEKLVDNQLAADERTAKKRAKRQKKKQNMKRAKAAKPAEKDAKAAGKEDEVVEESDDSDDETTAEKPDE